ncbi:type III secretion system chaperone family protein [Actinophytocola sediminis]
MGIPAWVWFVVAVAAGVAGAAMLLRDRARLTSRNRERRRWAALRGWQFADADQLLPTQWTGGAIAFHGGGAKDVTARDVVAGSTFTADGRRRVYVFDLDSGGRTTAVIAAVQCRRVLPAVVELWLPSAPFQREHMPELLGPIGQRYAFVSDLTAASGLITPDLVDATEEIGADIAVTWIENGWVLAGVAPHASPSRLERLLRGIGEVADVIDPFDAEVDPVGEHEPTGRHGERQD